MRQHLTYSVWILTGSIFTSACTETVYREIPTNGGVTPVITTPIQQAGALPPNVAIPQGLSPAVTSNMAGTVATPQSAAPPSATTPIVQPSGLNNTAPGNTIFADSPSANPTPNLSNVDGTVVGGAGLAVDCANTVPCRWLSEDSQISVTLTNADNIATRNRLSIHYSINSVHDTTIVMGNVDNAVDASAFQNPATELSLGGGSGAIPSTIVAGKTLSGVVSFTEPATTTQLTSWSVSVLDNGMIRKATFLNIPVGPITTDYADCNNRLPCVWATPNNHITITLQAAGGYAGNGRLTTNFHVNGNRDLQVAIDSGATAIGADGTRFTGRTHSLGNNSDYQQITEEAIANIGVSGSVDFYRTDNKPSSLANLALVVFEDSPTPRWNPRFTNVPVQ